MDQLPSFSLLGPPAGRPPGVLWLGHVPLAVVHLGEPALAV